MDPKTLIVAEIASESDDSDDPAPSTSTNGHGPAGRRATRGRPPKRKRSDDADDGWSDDLTGYGFGRDTAFTGRPSMNVPDDVRRPLDFFMLFFTTDIFKLIKAETNRYAATELPQKQLPPESLYKNWTTVKLIELLSFFTIWVHMALVKKPYLKDYWSTHDILRTSFAGKLMSRNRFMQILGLLHLNDNAQYIPYGQPGHDPLHKVRPIVNHLSNVFKAFVTPQQKVVIDEAICPWRGKIRFRVYMKDKPHKWGIKIYMLCESSSAYVYDFEIYCAQPGLSNKPVEVCKRIMEPLLQKGYILYTDNYYTCPTLSQDLAASNTMTVGTVRHNRVGMPADLAGLELRQGQSAFRRKGQLVAVRWQDKKSVNLLTTIHDPRETVTVTSRTQVKEKPKAVQDYTLNIKGVDRSDQLMAYLPINRRTMKWWKKLFIHLFTLTLIQVSILYNKRLKSEGKPPVAISRFIKMLGEEMAEEVARRKGEVAAEDQAATNVDRLYSRCFPDYIPPTEKKQRPTRVCRVCSEKAKTPGNHSKRKETSFWCSYHKVPLCVAPCFQDFHTKRDYTN